MNYFKIKTVHFIMYATCIWNRKKKRCRYSQIGSEKNIFTNQPRMVRKWRIFSRFRLMWARSRCTFFHSKNHMIRLFWLYLCDSFGMSEKKSVIAQYAMVCWLFCLALMLWSTYVSHFWDYIHLYSIYVYGYTLNLSKQQSLRRLDTWNFALERRWWME